MDKNSQKHFRNANDLKNVQKNFHHMNIMNDPCAHNFVDIDSTRYLSFE